MYLEYTLKCHRENGYSENKHAAIFEITDRLDKDFKKP